VSAFETGDLPGTPTIPALEAEIRELERAIRVESPDG
jgi:hypothetical protein